MNANECLEECACTSRRAGRRAQARARAQAHAQAAQEASAHTRAGSERLIMGGGARSASCAAHCLGTRDCRLAAGEARRD